MYEWQPGKAGDEILQRRVKTADETVTSSASPQLDDHLNYFRLAGYGRYKIEAFLAFNASADGPGIYMILGFSHAPWDYCPMMMRAVDQNGSVDQRTSFSLATSQVLGNFTTLDDNAYPCVHLNGFVFGPASNTQSTMHLYWSQSTSSGTGLTLNNGSWMELTRIG